MEEKQMSQSLFHNSTLTVQRTAGISARRRARRLSIPQSTLAATIGLWIARNRQRRHLAELAEWDDYLLKDIGVSRDAALRAAAKPFWRR